MMKESIGYLRVSTREQGRSGLGLAAQRFEIEAFGMREGFTVQSWHQDVQTGAGKDASLLRPGLAAGLKEARSARPSRKRSAGDYAFASIGSMHTTGRDRTPCVGQVYRAEASALSMSSGVQCFLSSSGNFPHLAATVSHAPAIWPSLSSP